jgi:hypothetical protein
VGQLQPDVQIVLSSGAESLDMCGDQLLAQPRDRRERALIEHQLVRIGATVVANGDGFTTPNQLRAALAEVLPAPDGQLARLALAGAVPPFHGKHTEAIAEADTADLKRFSERRRARGGNFRIEAKLDAFRDEMPLEELRRTQRRDARVSSLAHRSARAYGAGLSDVNGSAIIRGACTLLPTQITTTGCQGHRLRR